MNKEIHRESSSATRIFDNRTLEADYATLVPFLERGLRVLDVGCGTGAISRGIAERVGTTGSVVGIDNTEAFINRGKETCRDVRNLELMHVDLYDFKPEEKFDLVVAARVLQWLTHPKEALKKFVSFLKPGGAISVLDYNHEVLQWTPEPPETMKSFYQAFLSWRADAGMNNRIAEDLPAYFADTGLHSIETFGADEVYKKSDENFIERAGIWSKVAGLKQIVDEGYLSEEARLKAIDDYNEWVEKDARCMIMKLKEVRGRT
jgi:ubiquinone/menaquinone biosynthesis C-methylase UbiE